MRLKSSNLSRIIIVRHAHALDREEFARKNPNDLLRPLSKKGKTQSKKIAHFVRDFLHTKPISYLISSPATRALQTIKPLSKILTHTPFAICESIAPDCGCDGYIKLLEHYRDSQTLLIVGHQPDIEFFVRFLVGGASLTIKKGCVIELVRKTSDSQDSHNLTKWQDTFTLNLLIDPKRL